MASSTDCESEDSHYRANVERAKYIQDSGKTDGKYQSPVHLNISGMRIIELNPLKWYNYETPPRKYKLTNTGRTVIVSAKWQQERPFITDGPFLGKYVFSQTHMHWGTNDMEGSEHYIDGGRTIKRRLEVNKCLPLSSTRTLDVFPSSVSRLTDLNESKSV